MSTTSIGKLDRVPLRQVWEHEAYDLTQWLQENIAELNTTLDLTLVNVDREQAAGSFSIDLVAEDEGGGTADGRRLSLSGREMAGYSRWHHQDNEPAGTGTAALLENVKVELLAD